MNKKGELGIGILITVAIAIVIGLILFQNVASNVEKGTRSITGTVTVVNQTIATPAVGSLVELTGQELVGVPVVSNRTNADLVITANYTITECVRTSDNLKGICYRSTSNPLTYADAGAYVNVSYKYYPSGYIDDAGARSVTSLIVILTAVALVLIAFLGVRKFED